MVEAGILSIEHGRRCDRLFQADAVLAASTGSVLSLFPGRVPLAVLAATLPLSDAKAWRRARAALPRKAAYGLAKPMSAATDLNRSGSRSFRSE